MTQEDKELLLKDLCSRLPYHIVVNNGYENAIVRGIDNLDKNDSYCLLLIYFNPYDDEGTSLIDDIKPYLRPMSSMTEEEKEELLNLLFDKEAKYFYIDEEGFIDGKTSDLMKEGLNYPSFCPINIELYTGFLLSHHFDYRGLIEKGLALEAPKGMYNLKEK